MNRLEIIHLRSCGQELETLSARIRNSINLQNTNQVSITLYRREDLESDVAIHILHSTPADKGGPSDLGLHLTSALKSIGLVEHTVWVELESAQADNNKESSDGRTT